MKTEYRHIKFIEAGSVNGWVCLNRKSDCELGAVSFYEQWNQFVFEPHELGDIIFNSSCLRDIAHFLDQLNEQKKLTTVKFGLKINQSRRAGNK